MVINQVVIQLKNGNIIKGYTEDFMPNKDTFHLKDKNGKIEELRVDDAKAIFFVKDFDGDKDYNYTYEDVLSGEGKRFNVDFKDGERIVGYVLAFSPERKGFFMKPADLKGNNRRVFVVTSSLKKVEIIYSDEK